MKVMKFGGTSMGSPDAIVRCAAIVEREIKKSGQKPLVVVSAYSKVTDLLLDASAKAVKGDIDVPFAKIAHRHNEIVKGLNLPTELGQDLLYELEKLLIGIKMVREVTPRLYDYVASFGERLGARTFAAALKARGHNSEAFDAYDLDFKTDSRFMNARPLPDTYDKINAACKPHLAAGKIMVVTGFIAKDKNGDITTIGRSGSDYSASIFGAALKVDEIQVWKDVPGVMTCDPSLIPGAKPLPRLTFEEASELAYYGAEVLHPATIVPALKLGIPVRVQHTFNPDAEGTLITPEGSLDNSHPVKCIVYKEDQTLINVRSERMLGMEGFMARLFSTFEKHRVVIDMISTSEVSVSMTTDLTDEQRLDELRADLEEIAKVEIRPKKCLVAIVGEGQRHTIGLAARAFKAVASANVSLQMISQGASEINVTFLIDNSEIPPAVKALHKEFFGV